MFSILAQTESAWTFMDEALFIGLPYAAIALFFYGTIRRYVSSKFSYSSYSSQFLENRKLFFVSVPWHFGILALLLGHLIGFLIPRSVLWWNSVPARLYVIELGALIFAILALVGLAMALHRRATNTRLKVVTSKMDVLILVLLLLQVITGIWVAVAHRWGSSWFASVMSPYLWSLFQFSPDIGAMREMPLAVKLHVAGAFVIFAVFPFTRLVHMLVLPLHYFWRLPQRVIWNRKRARPATHPADVEGPGN